MSMNTYVEGTVKLKPEYVSLIAELDAIRCAPNQPWDAPNWWQTLAAKHSWLHTYADDEWSDSIPYRGYGDFTASSTLTGDVWDFECAAHAGGVLDKFLKIVLPRIAETAEVQTRYEEFQSWKNYRLENGEMKLVDADEYTGWEHGYGF